MDTWDRYNHISNWGVLANHGLFLAGILLPETERTRQYAHEAARRLAIEAGIQVFRDGTHWEQSPMYHNEVLQCFLDVVIIAQRSGFTLSAEFLSTVHKMCLFSAYSAKPGHCEPMLGDSDDIDVRDQITKAAAAFRDAKLKYCGYASPDFDSVWDMGEDGLQIYRDLKAEPPESFDHFFPDSGNAFLRSGPGESDTYVHFVCGNLGGGHSHADKTHVDITAFGEDILTDKGRYTYVFGPDRIFYKSLSSHNTLIVDNADLYVPTSSWTADNIAKAVNQKFFSCDMYAYASGGHTGYCAIADNPVFVNRRVLFLKPDIVIVCDEFFTSGAHEYTRNFHFSESGLVTVSGDNALFLGEKARAKIKFFAPSPAENEVYSSKLSRHYNEESPSRSIRATFSSAGSGAAYAFFALSERDNDKRFTVEKKTVKSSRWDDVYEDKAIEAFTVSFGGARYTVVFGHSEYASNTDCFDTDGVFGYGSVTVFDRSKDETCGGTVIEW